MNPFGDSISVINKSSGYENFDRGARPSVSWGLGRNYAEHGPGFPTSGRRGEDQDFHAPVSPYFLSRQESDGADTSAARSVHRAVREYDESVQLDRRGAVDRPREAGFRADEILDPFMAPCFGTIARFAKKNGTTRILCQIDNVEPHERHMTDKPFNRYFLRAVDGFIYMSEQVHRELRRYTQVPALFSPHPLFENFGIVIDRTEACIRLELDPSKRYALFFGLIRDYKGLDLLLDAWKIYKREHPAEDRRLIVAGEFYAPKEKYLKQIADNGLEDDVILHDYFIPDELVRYYFSVADFLVQPYRSATQSGVTQIAYQFDLPMVVTDVGGLPEIVPDGRVGFVCRPDAAEVARAIDRIWRDDVLAGFRANMEEEKKRFSWDAMCDRITELYRLVK